MNWHYLLVTILVRKLNKIFIIVTFLTQSQIWCITLYFPIKLLLLRPSKNVDYCFKTVYSRIVLCDQTCDFVIILVIRLVIKLVDQLFTLCLSRAESIKKPSFQMPRLWTTVSKQTRMKMHKIMTLGTNQPTYLWNWRLKLSNCNWVFQLFFNF